ncbi:hypothetical protein [Sorangium cellulosum]|uniref:hypothetical protein n=1 Tax=Sorangium cellulosum TaxID=56 RepID=UPI0012FF720B|nr:hypothetical protein [Sorangium cellulosum]
MVGSRESKSDPGVKLVVAPVHRTDTLHTLVDIETPSTLELPPGKWRCLMRLDRRSAFKCIKICCQRAPRERCWQLDALTA